MRKLKLQVDDLRVETFAAGEPAPRAGTIRGNMPMVIDASDDPCTGGGSGPDTYAYTCTCPSDPTCRHTCAQTCGIDYCSDLTQCASAPYCCP